MRTPDSIKAEIAEHEAAIRRLHREAAADAADRLMRALITGRAA